MTGQFTITTSHLASWISFNLRPPTLPLARPFHVESAGILDGSPAATRRKLRHVTAVSRVGKRKAHMLHAFPFHRKIVERELIDVRYQIGFPVALGHMFVVAQKIFALVKAVAKVEWIAKDKVLVV